MKLVLVLLLCSLSQRLKVVLPATDFSIDAAHEVSTAVQSTMLHSASLWLALDMSKVAFNNT